MVTVPTDRELATELSGVVTLMCIVCCRHTTVKTVGVMGDSRTYEYVCALRAVTSVDGMTADYYPFSHNFLSETATSIINNVSGINRVTYDITSKPPGTIEWE